MPHYFFMAERAQLSRPPLERMLRIHDELRRNTLTNCTKLGRLLEVTRKTILRDIAFMRDRLDLPIEYDPAIQAYRYTHPVNAFPTVQVTEGELLALLVARRALEQYQGTPFHRQLEVAFEKLAGGLKDRISFAPADELSAVSFKNIGLGRADLTVFNALSAAVLRQHEVEFDYRKPGEAKAARRHVQPYHLSHRENLWYLVGLDVGRVGLRTFALPRITAVRVLEQEVDAAGLAERHLPPVRRIAGQLRHHFGRQRLGDQPVGVHGVDADQAAAVLDQLQRPGQLALRRVRLR